MFTRKRWLGLGAAVMATGVAGAEPQDDQHAYHQKVTQHGAMEGGEGGEGGEGASLADAVTSDVAYLTQLALIRGHLAVGMALYREGDQPAAATHMKHPEDEVYTDLLPALETRGARGFGDELRLMADTVVNKQPQEDVEAAYAAVLEAIQQAEAATGAPHADVLAGVLTSVTKTLAAEYDIAVEEGQVVNTHEYQDAFGFASVAESLLQTLGKVTQNQQALDEIAAQLGVIRTAVPGFTKPDAADTSPAVVYGAAARIELAAFSL